MEDPNDNLIPEQDREFLKEKEYEYSITPIGGTIHLVIMNFEFPPNYLPRNSDLLILLPAGYPNAPPDMFRTYPDVKLLNGAWPVTSEPHEVYMGKQWQRWSRHIAWRVGIDCLRSFISAIKTELKKGI